MRRRILKPHRPYRNPLSRLADEMAAQLAERGQVRSAAAPWLAAAAAIITNARGCGWERDTTPPQMVERVLQPLGWVWRWEGEELVIELPGWTPPPPRVVAVQPSLF